MDESLKQTDEIYCPECAKPIKRNAVICVNCGIQIKKLEFKTPTVKIEQEVAPKIKDDNNSSFARMNHRKIFNICLYTVLGFLAVAIFISSFRSIAYLLGTIADIFFNIWIWLFIIFIFIYRANKKLWELILSIVFGFITIFASIGLFFMR